MHTYNTTLAFNIETKNYEYLPFEVEGRRFHTVYIIPANLRLLTDKEREKLSEKSSYFGDGNELVYTNE